MYRFVRCQTHPKCPDLQGWYLVLKPDDLLTFMDLHHGVAQYYWYKFGKNPHLKDAPTIYNPLTLANLWLKGVEKYRVDGITIGVNSRGGILPLDSVRVLATVEKDKMAWPTLHKGEAITITRWPEMSHWYLTSDKDRIFVPIKYTRLEDARRVAQLYTENIKVVEQ